MKVLCINISPLCRRRKMKQYIVDIKGICILEDEWEDAKITITRNGIADTIEFDKSDIVKTEEIEEIEE